MPCGRLYALPCGLSFEPTVKAKRCGIRHLSTFMLMATGISRIMNAAIGESIGIFDDVIRAEFPEKKA